MRACWAANFDVLRPVNRCRFRRSMRAESSPSGHFGSPLPGPTTCWPIASKDLHACGCGLVEQRSHGWGRHPLIATSYESETNPVKFSRSDSSANPTARRRSGQDECSRKNEEVETKNETNQIDFHGRSRLNPSHRSRRAHRRSEGDQTGENAGDANAGIKIYLHVGALNVRAYLKKANSAMTVLFRPFASVTFSASWRDRSLYRHCCWSLS